jgi:uncharacterized damage-inducible protein DinB
MELLEHLRRSFAYDHWANGEALRSAEGNERALRLMAHIAAAEWLWWARLRNEASPAPVWPELSAAQCGEHLGELASRWREYLGSLTAGDLTRDVSYVNSKGESWRSTVLDILTHTVTHSAYHRGQVALVLRQQGSEPAYTDYIHCMRGRFLE